jgi:hypothetical protein
MQRDRLRFDPLWGFFKMSLDIGHVAMQVEVFFAGKLFDKGDDSGIVYILVQLIPDAPFLLVGRRHQGM